MDGHSERQVGIKPYDGPLAQETVEWQSLPEKIIEFSNFIDSILVNGIFIVTFLLYQNLETDS